MLRSYTYRLIDPAPYRSTLQHSAWLGWELRHIGGRSLSFQAFQNIQRSVHLKQSEGSGVSRSRSQASRRSSDEVSRQSHFGGRPTVVLLSLLDPLFAVVALSTGNTPSCKARISKHAKDEFSRLIGRLNRLKSTPYFSGNFAPGFLPARSFHITAFVLLQRESVVAATRSCHLVTFKQRPPEHGGRRGFRGGAQVFFVSALW